MLMLDCQSVESAYSSVAEITQVPVHLLRAALLAAESPTSSEALVNHVRDNLGAITVSSFSTCWFHLTRVPETTGFAEGLLPLHARLDAIWAYLEEIAEGEGGTAFIEFRAGFEAQRGTHYESKASNAAHGGPYGLLVRDTPFLSKLGSGHFFEAPEIVVDICEPFRERFGIDLLDRFVKRTRPCIVKFWHQGQNPKALGTALYYLYCAEHALNLGLYGHLDFDGSGIAVPPDRIVRVEFPEVHDRRKCRLTSA